MDIPEFFKFDELYNCEGVLVPAMRALKNKKLVGFLFSASWSSDCEEFLSSLKQIYQENLKRKFGLEIVYISLDYDEKAFLQHFKSKHSGWYATKFRDPVAEETRFIYEVSTIPQLAVIRTLDGVVVTKTGREEIQGLGKNVLVAWSS